jgi:hypothetical protein
MVTHETVPAGRGVDGGYLGSKVSVLLLDVSGIPAGAGPAGVWSAATRMRTHRAHRESGSWG